MVITDLESGQKSDVRIDDSVLDEMKEEQED